MGDATKKFELPEAIVADSLVSFYCKADDCNVEEGIKAAFKDDGPLTLEAMKADLGAGGAPVGDGGATVGDGGAPADVVPPVGGADKTTVAVATITFSMAMARLAL